MLRFYRANSLFSGLESQIIHLGTTKACAPIYYNKVSSGKSAPARRDTVLPVLGPGETAAAPSPPSAKALILSASLKPRDCGSAPLCPLTLPEHPADCSGVQKAPATLSAVHTPAGPCLPQRSCLRVKARKLRLQPTGPFAACPGAQKGLAVLSAAYTPAGPRTGKKGCFPCPALG